MSFFALLCVLAPHPVCASILSQEHGYLSGLVVESQGLPGFHSAPCGNASCCSTTWVCCSQRLLPGTEALFKDDTGMGHVCSTHLTKHTSHLNTQNTPHKTHLTPEHTKHSTQNTPHKTHLTPEHTKHSSHLSTQNTAHKTHLTPEHTRHTSHLNTQNTPHT